MRAELRYRRDKCARFFPDLDELELISREFLKRLRKRQAEQFPVVTNIADVLNDFWNSEWGERKARAYGQLCAHQHESLRLYKELRFLIFFVSKKEQNEFSKWSLGLPLVRTRFRI